MKASRQVRFPWFRRGLLLAPGALLVGCASPGAPKPPSLHLPAVVKDLVAARSGDRVELRFMPPDETTDGLPLGKDPLTVTACRQDGPRMPCRTFPLPDREKVLPSQTQDGAAVQLHDELPEPLRTGPPRPLFYRVEVQNAQGKSAGPSVAAIAPAGAAPPKVEGLQAQGVRTGVLLQWTPQDGAGEILLERELLDRVKPATVKSGRDQRTAETKGSLGNLVAGPASHAGEDEPGTVWLQANPGVSAARETIDGTVVEGVRYRYTAVRRVQVHAGEQAIEMRSTPSSPVEVAWNDVYPPPPPTELTAVGFGGPEPGAADHPEAPRRENSTFAVDLVWQPVNDARTTGYLVSRVTLLAGQERGAPVQLTPAPVAVPAFHDATAQATESYRYQVVAVDGAGNRSPAASATVEATRR